MAEPIPTLLLDPGAEPLKGELTIPPDAHVSGELVSCLMLSRGALSPARHAIDCFRRQTYVERELVIVVDEPGTALAAYVADLDDPAIRLIETGRATLGELRNVSVAHARGEYLMQWDDDDLAHPQRIELMVAGLEASDATAAFLLRWLMWWPAQRRFAVSERRLWEGTMLARRGLLPIYPALGRMEDTYVMRRLRRHGRVIAIDQPLTYCYIVHGSNSCAPSHFEGLFRRATRVIGPDRYDEDLALMQRFLPLRAYAADLGLSL